MGKELFLLELGKLLDEKLNNSLDSLSMELKKTRLEIEKLSDSINELDTIIKRMTNSKIEFHTSSGNLFKKS